MDIIIFSCKLAQVFRQTNPVVPFWNDILNSPIRLFILKGCKQKELKKQSILNKIKRTVRVCVLVW